MRFKTFGINSTPLNKSNHHSRRYGRDRFFTARPHRDKLRKVRGNRFHFPNMRYSDCHRVCGHRGNWTIV